MITLVFLACVVNNVRCEQIERPWDGSLQACALFGQQEIARWLADQPGWVVRGGYKCIEGRDA